MYKKYFPALKKYNNLIFCDNAGGSQIPYHILNKTNKFLINNYVQPYSNNILSKKMTEDLNKIKNFTNKIFNNKDGTIIYGSSSTQLFYNLANSLENSLLLKSSNIILNNFSHEAPISPFERISKKNNIEMKWWNLQSNENKYMLDYDNLFSKIDSNTSLIVLPHVSNILGNILDIKYLNQECKKINKNVKILVDGVAFLPHELIDINELGIDYYGISFYKFCGLRVSALYVKDIEQVENQNHYFFNNCDKDHITKKLELGGWNFESASSLLGLNDYIFELSKEHHKKDKQNSDNLSRNDIKFVMNKIKNYEKTLTKEFYNGLDTNDEIKIIEESNADKIPIFSLLFNNYKSHNVNLILNELGLICNNSTFYCDRLFEHLNLSKNNGVLRISLMHYNSISEVKKICNYLNMFKKFKLNFSFKEYNIKPSHLLKHSFNSLEKDSYYDVERYRAFSLVDIENINTIKVVGDLNFFQSSDYNNYNGNTLRKYPNISEHILNDESFKRYVQTFKNKIKKQTKETPKFIQIHQIRVNANNNDSKVTPEGIHRDGFNMIGILCINRVNIKDGINNFYDNNKKKIYSKKMESGDFIILNDNDNYHDVTDIKVDNINNISYRDVFIFTSIS